MSIKNYKPTTPSRRQMTTNGFDAVTTSKPQKSLLTFVKNKAGRNNQGKITVRHKGGGHKRKYRLVDFDQTKKLNIEGKVTTVEYDPYRSAFIMLVTYVDGDKRYHLAPNDIQVGQSILTAEKTEIQTGNRMQLRNIPVGYPIHNLELTPKKGGQMVKSAGSSAKVVSLEGAKAQVELPSGEVRLIPKDCYATIGTVSNHDHGNIVIGKAGRSRWMRKRPTVRGKVMNPCDHPHGGGEGANPIGLKHPKTPWGLPALGVKTRAKKKYSNKDILKRRKK